jgi:hypothetical protein
VPGENRHRSSEEISQNDRFTNVRFTDSEGLTQMAWQRSDEQAWTGTLFARGPASVTVPDAAGSPIWGQPFDVRLAEDEEEGGEEVEDDEEDDEDDVDEEELDDEDFDDEDFDDEFDDDDLDDDEDDDEEEEEDDEEDY